MSEPTSTVKWRRLKDEKPRDGQPVLFSRAPAYPGAPTDVQPAYARYVFDELYWADGKHTPSALDLLYPSQPSDMWAPMPDAPNR